MAVTRAGMTAYFNAGKMIFGHLQERRTKMADASDRPITNLSRTMTHKLTLATLALLLGHGMTAQAGQPEDFIAEFKQQAAKENPQFAGFDSKRGEEFFQAKHSDWSCATCHTDDPRKTGKHATTEKDIKPLAPVANPERFTDAKKVAKWFKRNCNDVLKRQCDAQEKGDMLSYLLSLKN